MSLRKIWLIIWKDIITEFRTKELLAAMFVFALTILLIFNFSFSYYIEDVHEVTSGMLWISFIFAGVLGLSRSFALEKEGNAIMGLMLTPIDRSDIFIGKFLSNTFFVFFTQIILLPIFIIFFNIELSVRLFELVLVFLLGSIGFVSIGTLFSAISINTKLREVLLPILIFPVIIPVVVSAVKLSNTILSGESIITSSGSLKLIIAFDIIFVLACSLVFEYVLEES